MLFIYSARILISSFASFFKAYEGSSENISGSITKWADDRRGLFLKAMLNNGYEKI